MCCNILFLEDDRTQLFLYKSMCHKFLSNQKVFYTQTVSDAESVMRDNDISLAVLDLMIPVENGADLIVKMRKNSSYKDTKIIVVSAANETSLLYHSLAGYTDKFVTKPIVQEDFAGMIKGFLES